MSMKNSRLVELIMKKTLTYFLCHRLILRGVLLLLYAGVRTSIPQEPYSCLRFQVRSGPQVPLWVHACTYFVCFCWLILLLTPHHQSFSYIGTGLPGLNQYLARINVSCSRTQRSDADESRTHGPSVSSQALSHCAPILCLFNL